MPAETDDRKREKSMSRLCIASVMIIFLSLVCIVVGSLAISESAPDYIFPYCLGGAMIAGVMSIISACCNMCVYCEYSGMNVDTVQSWACWMSVVISFVVISLILGVGMSGIWGMTQSIDHNKVGQTDDKFGRQTYDVAYEKGNLKYAIASFVLVLLLNILHIVSWCYCCTFLDTYGFLSTTYTHDQIQHEINRMRQNIREDPHATRENYSRGGISYTIPIPEIYHGTLQPPSAPRESVHSSTPPSYHVTSTGNGANLAAEEPTDRLPPPYEEIAEDLPSYQEVVTEGRYISTGNTEFVTKI